LAEVGVTVNKSNHEVKYCNIGRPTAEYQTFGCINFSYLANLLKSQN